MSRAQAWGRYWESGMLTTFGDKPIYEGELRDLWLDVFSALPSGAVVVDLGAGNGALAEIAKKHCVDSGVSFEMHAIDAAKIVRRVETKGTGLDLHLHPSTRNEATGLPDGSVDAVTGNFAFEYGDETATAAEIRRILKPGGKCRFLMHHAASAVIVDSRGELELLGELLRGGGLFDEMRDFLREFGHIRKPRQLEQFRTSRNANEHLSRINGLHAAALAKVATPNAEALLTRVTRMMNQLISPPMFLEPKQVLMQHLATARIEFAANRARLDDMQHAAVDTARLENIGVAFATVGLHVDAEPFHVAQITAPVGWKVDVRFSS